MNGAILRREAYAYGVQLLPLARCRAAGIALALALASLAHGLSATAGGPAMVYALTLGFLARYAIPARHVEAGIGFSAQTLLRLGVGLLGAGITFQHVSALGLPVVALAAGGVVLTIGMGLVCARMLGIGRDLGFLLGGAVAICGASAALAIASVLPKTPRSEENTLLAVVGVTALSTIAMVLYPLAALTLGMSDRMAGIFFGAAIHDVAQVVGAGYAISDQTGETATVVKLFRVACLVPVVAVIGLWTRSGAGHRDVGRLGRLFPWFLGLFILLSAVASLNLLPAAVASGAASIAKFLLLTAIAGLGFKTSFGALGDVGFRPVVVLVLATAGLALAVAAMTTAFPGVYG